MALSKKNLVLAISLVVVIIAGLAGISWTGKIRGDGN